MEAHTERVEQRRASIERTLAGRNPDRIEEGIAAYRRDLAQLIKDNKYQFIAAYDGDVRVGLAPNHRKLEKQLAKLTHLNRNNLFIVCIVPPEVDEDPGLGL